METGSYGGASDGRRSVIVVARITYVMAMVVQKISRERDGISRSMLLFGCISFVLLCCLVLLPLFEQLLHLWSPHVFALLQLVVPEYICAELEVGLARSYEVGHHAQ